MSTVDQKLVKRQRFEGVFSQIVEELLQFLQSQNMPKEAVDWYKRNLEYNTPGGKLNRGLSVVDTVKSCCARTASASLVRKSMCKLLCWAGAWSCCRPTSSWPTT